MIYLDTSAFLKLVWRETERSALESFLASHEEPRVSSTLLVVEARRAALRLDPTALPSVDLMLTRIGQITIGPAIVEAASRLPQSHLRSLDAIHLATALHLGPDLTAFVSYDKRLVSAAQAERLPILAPAG